MNEIHALNDLIEISKYAGERFDLVQAGGGNSSVKINNDEMLIKASGTLLSDISKTNGYVKVSISKLRNIIKNYETIFLNKTNNELLTNLINDSKIDNTQQRPSIESLLHSILLKYTLHTHPIVVNMICIRKDWNLILTEIFKNETIGLIHYKTPGIELALELSKEIQKLQTIPQIIFLQNHGLIITSNIKDEIKKLNEMTLNKIEKYLNIDMTCYKYTNKISQILNKIQNLENISYLSEDIFLNKILKENPNLFFELPFCPDTLVYCGISACKINDIEKFILTYNELPKVIISDDKLFFIAPNVKKAKEMEEVMKAHIMVLNQCKEHDKNFLLNDELNYLKNWEAEKYRQKL